MALHTAALEPASRPASAPCSHGASFALLQVEGAVKRAPLEERKKRKQEVAAAPAQPAPAAAAAAGAEPEAQPPAAKKPRPTRPAAAAPRDVAAEGKHKWMRAVAVGGLTAEAVDAAVQMARAAGQVGLACKSTAQECPLCAACLLRHPAITGRQRQR